MNRLAPISGGKIEESGQCEAANFASPLATRPLGAVKMRKSQYSGSLSEQEDVFAVAGTMATADLPPFPINFDEVPF